MLAPYLQRHLLKEVLGGRAEHPPWDRFVADPVVGDYLRARRFHGGRADGVRRRTRPAARAVPARPRPPTRRAPTVFTWSVSSWTRSASSSTACRAWTSAPAPWWMGGSSRACTSSTSGSGASTR